MSDYDVCIIGSGAGGGRALRGGGGCEEKVANRVVRAGIEPGRRHVAFAAAIHGDRPGMRLASGARGQCQV